MDDLTDRDAQSQSDRDLRTSQGVRSQQIPPRKAKVSKDIEKTFEDCQVCGGSFKKGRGMRIHLAKSKAGCKRILESRNYKSRFGSSQENHHSGSTNKNIPDTTASTIEATEEREMWSIFNIYPETLSQCVGRKIKMLRLQSAAIDLHDEVETEVKETMAEEERADQDILVIDDDEEEAIRKEVENVVQAGIGPKESRPERGSHYIQRVKSIVRRPDIRNWLINQAEVKVIDNNDRERKTEKDEGASTSEVKSAEPRPDLREWIEHNKKEPKLPNSLNIIEVTEEEPLEIKSTVSRSDLRNWISCNTGLKKGETTTPDSIEGQVKTSSKVKSAVSKPDLRDWISASAGRRENTEPNESPDERMSEKPANGNKIKSTVSRPDIREWLSSKPKMEVGKAKPRNVETQKEKEFEAIVKSLDKGPPDEILSRKYLEMSRRDYRSLAGRNYLNDKIIDEYLYIIQERNQIEQMQRVYALTTHAYSWLEADFERNFPKVSRWCIRDITSMDMILVPIHKADHWSLVVVDIAKETLSYYDSIYGNRRRSNAPRVVKRFMESLWCSMQKEIKLKIKIIENAPQQGNGYDCGVFVCQNAEKIARGALVNTKQEDMPNARKRMMKEIFFGTLNIEIDPVKAAEKPQEKTQLKKKTGSRAHIEVKSTVKEKEKAVPRKVESSSKERTSRQNAAKPKIKWPKGNSKEWEKLDEDLTALLRILYSPPEKLAESHPRIIYEMGKERYGVVESGIAHKKKPAGPSKRQRRCKRLREEINQLKQTYKEAPQDEKEGINELQKEKLKMLRLAKRAESLKQGRKKFSLNCREFLGQPYQFSRNLLAPKPKGDLLSSKEEVELHLKSAHSDPDNGKERPDKEDLKHYEVTDLEFNDDPPVYREFAKKLRKARSKSAPGPNGVPYLVYKRCPGVAKLLHGYLRLLWKRNIISDCWREAEGIFIPKEEGARTVDKFRTISLLNVEGKLFFAMKSDRITDFLVGSGYIDPAVQKGGIPGVSGCLEHTSILSQLIREAKAEKKNLVVTWLDIANAYGSIPHDVIKKALERAHVPERPRQLIESYYSNVKIRFTTKTFTTEWQKVERGIITGCTLSVILFALTMSWLVESNKKVTQGPKTSSGQRQANSRVFMDDITSSTETVPQTRYLLSSTDSNLKWAGLTARAKKCRSLVIVKGKVKRRLLKIGGEVITPIQEQPIKHLGKQYNDKLNETDQIEFVTKNVVTDLKRIDRCKLPGRYKAWIVQHMMMPRLMWPLSIYNVPLTTVEWLQGKITSALKKWLKLPRSLSSACFYSKSSKLKLPYTGLVEEYKATKARNLVTLQESKDECIRNANITIDAGTKANTPKAVDDAKSHLRIQELVGVPNKGKEGLGMKRRQYYSSSNSKEKRDMIVKRVRDKEEEGRLVKMTGFSNQGANLRWEVPQKQIKHNDIIRSSEERLRFLVKSVYDMLPTPANKNRWFKTEEKCLLCGKEGTLVHILSGCSVALSQGRYKWRHDKVLKELASSVQGKIVENTKKTENRRTRIQFVREGENSQRNAVEEHYTYLSNVKDWKMTVDLEGCLKIPREICETNLRPDLIIVSKKTKQVGVVELTVPNEDRIEVSGEIKRKKYEQIVQEGRRNGWRVRVWAVEVGCRGFPAVSMSSFFKDLGFRGSEKKKAIDRLSKTAEDASNSLWRASHFKNWRGSDTSAQ